MGQKAGEIRPTTAIYRSIFLGVLFFKFYGKFMEKVDSKTYKILLKMFAISLYFLKVVTLALFSLQRSSPRSIAERVPNFLRKKYKVKVLTKIFRGF